MCLSRSVDKTSSVAGDLNDPFRVVSSPQVFLCFVHRPADVRHGCLIACFERLLHFCCCCCTVPRTQRCRFVKDSFVQRPSSGLLGSTLWSEEDRCSFRVMALEQPSTNWDSFGRPRQVGGPMFFISAPATWCTVNAGGAVNAVLPTPSPWTPPRPQGELLRHKSSRSW
jgi:hypothetical protein